MIGYVNGILEYIEEDNAVIDVNGVGMNVKVSSGVISRLPSYGEPVKLYTYTSVREDAIWLYGFLSRNDLSLFKKIIAVNGIGPKSGQAILGAMDADDFRYAIISQDKKTLSKLPGIGAKTAERLILELKDKLVIDDEMINREILDTAISSDSGSEVLSDAKKEALEALIALGYPKTDCMKALNSMENIENMDTSAILKLALKKLF